MSETLNNRAPETPEKNLFNQLSEELQERFTTQSTEATQSLAASVGLDNLPRVDLWEIISGQVAKIARNNTLFLVNEHIPLEDDSVIESIYRNVSVDLLGSPDLGIYTGRDIVDWGTGEKLLDECREIEDLTPKECSEAMETTHLLCHYGLYKFAKWGNGSQLLLATELAKEIALKGSLANLDDLEPIENMLLLLEAACTIDNKTKPNYQYAKPERLYIMQTNYAARVNLSTAHMHIATKHDSNPPTSGQDH